MSLKEIIGRKFGYVSKDRLVTDHRDGSFVENYDRICQENQAKKEKWVKWLKGGGIKAAHPDDGWHKRDEEYFMFSYPHFNDGVNVKDRVALGSFERFIILTVTKIDRVWGMKKYHYSVKHY